MIVADANTDSLAKDVFTNVMKRKNDLYLSSLESVNHDQALPNIRKFLQEAKAAGLKLAIASASRNAPAILKSLGLMSIIDAIADPQDCARGKPAPDIFLEAARLVGVDPKLCIGFEDAPAGIKGIKEAGMYAIGIGDANTLSEADFVIEDTRALSLSQLLNKFEANNNKEKSASSPKFEIDPWLITLKGLSLDHDHRRIAESIFSLGNEYMGCRGNFEEQYSGDSHQGAYLGGV
ncbi:unnamed protein product [Didymodactylos carnosus]|uniref:Glycoside hydrolase family 65 N-terminal domain-containing protein n=1 Tax=Didymodactylos carnosus TaxID=1234261 RepID=A0A8S2CRI3_9BILA|nr:unnamed protein product [Didymodactylos carnosus]CAF3565288.1 unnamed protein product [Didymodactylos carnosus]